MSGNNFDEQFPDMRPVNSPPGLFTFNGFGLGVYGARDHDQESGTYVKNHCLCAVFMPIVAIGAYRVADAGNGGWHFIGKEPMSAFAKMWNLTIALAIAGAIGYTYINLYTNSSDYVDGNKMEQAAEMVEQSEIVPAAGLYAQIMRGSSVHATEARQRLETIVDETIDVANIDEALNVLRVAVGLQRSGRWNSDPTNLVERGVELANLQKKLDPREALRFLESVEEIAHDKVPIETLRRELVEAAVAKHPDDVELVSMYAVALEREGEVDRCEVLLTPLINGLGDTEGARILGQILASQGDIEKSHSLLLPYTERLLKDYHEAEDRARSAYESAYNRVLNALRQGDGPKQFYQRYDAANEAEQGALVQAYVDQRIANDPAITRAQEELMEEADIVPVAIDLGIVILRRGQAMSDAEARRAELEKAEKTFLANIYSFLDNERELAELLKRLDESEPDLSAARQSAMEFYSGANDDKCREELPVSLKRRRAAMEDAQQNANERTFALAANLLIARENAALTLDLPTDLDAIVKLAEDA